MSANPRTQNGHRRRRFRERFKAMDAPCGICKGRLGPIHYNEPSNHQFPLSFVIDEIIPVSRAELGGYESARGAAEDWGNLQAAHYICNQWKSNRILGENTDGTPVDGLKNDGKKIRNISVKDGDW